MTENSHAEEDYEQQAVLLFDGVCNLCSQAVLFIIPRDPEGTVHFASLQSDTGQRLLTWHGLSPDKLDTIVLIEAGKSYIKSTAALKIAQKLYRLWPLLYVFIIIPRPLRDAVYDWIARNRYRWFGKKEQCLMPTPAIRERFLS
ncbi:thiol-disulfide oxidoreductase DCC family protein [Aneurinibacillus migulanus]|uniref:thiol-disulfide oxidoreductase DCC family protein n=1 Tax=Aneurinibacillus migulanus TaxID=47500 RepID=UPI002E1D0705|nr:thiol-disulfide oxidoreductase DCC family protein [Aneurinibacillus migulanus]